MKELLYPDSFFKKLAARHRSQIDFKELVGVNGKCKRSINDVGGIVRIDDTTDFHSYCYVDFEPQSDWGDGFGAKISVLFNKTESGINVDGLKDIEIRTDQDEVGDSEEFIENVTSSRGPTIGILINGFFSSVYLVQNKEGIFGEEEIVGETTKMNNGMPMSFKDESLKKYQVQLEKYIGVGFQKDVSKTRKKLAKEIKKLFLKNKTVEELPIMEVSKRFNLEEIFN